MTYDTLELAGAATIVFAAGSLGVGLVFVSVRRRDAGALLLAGLLASSVFAAVVYLATREPPPMKGYPFF